MKSTVGFQEELEEEPANTSLLDQFNEAATLNKTQVGVCLWLFFEAACVLRTCG